MEKEKRLLETAEFEAFEEEVRRLQQEFGTRFNMHRHVDKLKTFLERYLGDSVKVLQRRDYVRYRDYHRVLENLLYALLEQALNEWVQLGENEADRPKFAEIIMSRHISVKDRAVIRLGKYIKAVESNQPVDEGNIYFSKYLMLMLGLVSNNYACVEFVKGQEIDAISKLLKVAEMVDLFPEKCHIDLVVKSFIFSNIGYALKRLDKHADCMVFYHNAAFVIEQVMDKRFDDETVEHVLELTAMNCLNLRFAENYFKDPDLSSIGVDLSRPAKHVELYHYYLYLDLYQILATLRL